MFSTYFPIYYIYIKAHNIIIQNKTRAIQYSVLFLYISQSGVENFNIHNTFNAYIVKSTNVYIFMLLYPPKLVVTLI